MTLSPAQRAVLRDLQTMPARHRHHRRAGGWIRWEYIEHFDARTLNSLCNRGLVETSEHGIRAKGDTP